MSGEVRPQAPSMHRFSRWMQFALLALYLAHATVMLCVLPPFEGWDEYQHVAYIVHLLEQGRPPLLGQDGVPETLLRELPRFPGSRHAVEQLGPVGVIEYSEYWAHDPPRTREFRAPPGPIPIYQAQHAPFYYRLAAPLFRAAGGTANLPASLTALRIANVLLGGVAVLLLLRALFRLCIDPRHAALMGAITVLNPIFVLNLARVANDALGVALATAAIGWCMLLRRERLPLQTGAIGLLIGCAVLGKASHLALLPFAVMTLLLFARKQRCSLAATGIALSALLAGVILPTADYFADNVRRFGTLFPIQEAVANQQAGRGIADLWRAACELPWNTLMRDFWGRHMLWRGGWSFLPPSKHWTQAYEYTGAIALMGGIFLLRRRRRIEGAVFTGPTTSAACAIVWACYSAGLAYHAIQTHIAWNTVATNAWYAAAGLPWLIALTVRCAAAWPGRLLKYVPCLNLVAILVYVAYDGVAHRMIPEYTQLEAGWPALRRLAALQPAGLGTTPLLCAAGIAAAALIAAGAGWGRSAARRPLAA